MTDRAPRTGLTSASRLLRLSLALQTLLVLGQIGLAGGFLNGHYDLLAWHEILGDSIAGAAVLTLACAVLLRRRGGHRWTVPLAVLGLVAVVLQIYAGYSRTLILHIPLGSLLLAALALSLALAWPRRGTTTRQGTTSGRGGAAGLTGFERIG